MPVWVQSRIRPSSTREKDSSCAVSSREEHICPSCGITTNRKWHHLPLNSISCRKTHWRWTGQANSMLGCIRARPKTKWTSTWDIPAAEISMWLWRVRIHHFGFSVNPNRRHVMNANVMGAVYNFQNSSPHPDWRSQCSGMGLICWLTSAVVWSVEVLRWRFICCWTGWRFKRSGSLHWTPGFFCPSLWVWIWEPLDVKPRQKTNSSSLILSIWKWVCVCV